MLKHLNSEDLARPGWVNYSGLNVLSENKGGTYIMGFNPGADDSNKTLSEYEPAQDSNWSAFVDVCWRRHSGGRCNHDRIRLTRHQEQVVALSDKLGLPVQKIFGTNAIFLATNNTGQLARGEIKRLWDNCWPIHQRFLAQMKPKMIVSLGNEVGSAFELLKGKAASWEVLGCFRGEGEAFARWKAAAALLPLGGGSTFSLTIMALPHPSRSHLFGSLAENFGKYQQMREAN